MSLFLFLSYRVCVYRGVYVRCMCVCVFVESFRSLTHRCVENRDDGRMKGDAEGKKKREEKEEYKSR